MRAITILRRRVKENLVVCNEYDNCIKRCEAQQKQLEEKKKFCEDKINLIKKENKSIEKTIEIIEGKLEDEENI